MTQFLPADFKRMRFNVYELEPEQSVVDSFPVLGQLRSWQTDTGLIPLNLLHRYIIFSYDSGSPLREVENLPKRKEIALDLAAIIDRHEGVDALVTNQLPKIREMIIDFCKLQNDRLHCMKVSALEAFYEYQQIIIDPIDAEELDDDKVMRAANLKTKLIQDCDLIHQKIKAYNQEIYGSAEDGQEIEPDYSISPENISRLMSQ